MVICIMYILKRGALCLDFKKMGMCMCMSLLFCIFFKVMLLSVQWATSSMSIAFLGACHHHHHHIYFRLPERPQKPIELATMAIRVVLPILL